MEISRIESTGPMNGISSKLRKARIPVLILSGITVVLLVSTIYPLRELLVAELVFGAAFLALLLIGAGLYLIGTIGQRAFELLETEMQTLGRSCRALIQHLSRADTMNERALIPVLALTKRNVHEAGRGRR